MRRALALVVLLFFAASSEGTTLCLRTPTIAVVTANHACCDDDAMASSRQAICCSNAPGDRDMGITPRAGYADALHLAPTQYFVLPRTDAVAGSQMSQAMHGVSASSLPLYLQHLSLLI